MISADNDILAHINIRVMKSQIQYRDGCYDNCIWLGQTDPLTVTQYFQRNPHSQLMLTNKTTESQIWLLL